MIVSKLHKLIELMPDDEKSRPGIKQLKEDFRADPIFIFGDDVCELLLSSDAAMNSFKAMATMGLVHIPYPKMTVQFQGTKEASPYTWFISLRENADGTFFARDAFYRKDGLAGVMEGGTVMQVMPEAFKCDTAGTKTSAQASAVALQLAVLMTQIAGLEREEIDAPEKLNKARVAQGKEPVRSYSYVHVAHVYGPNGERYSRSGSLGRMMPIHMRAGHIRMQAHGKGRAERKPIWIPPVVVNYKPGELDKPIVEKRVVK